MLLAAGAHVDARNEAGQTPVDVAELNGEKTMSKMLQEKGGTASAKFVN
jgi:ankyrin repeat protein